MVTSCGRGGLRPRLKGGKSHVNDTTEAAATDTVATAAGSVARLTLFGLATTVFLLIGASSLLGADYVDGLRERLRLTGSDVERTRDAVLLWRQAAWVHDDFLAQVQLGDIYSDNRQLRSGPRGSGPDSPRFRDRIEAYVWYFLASQNERFAQYAFSEAGRKMVAAKLKSARDGQTFLLLRMTQAEREEARNRITYILNCRNADGFIRLGRIHKEVPPPVPDRGEDGAPRLKDINRMIRDDIRTPRFQGNDVPLAQATGLASSTVFVHDLFTALMYFYIAEYHGSHLAQNFIQEAISEINPSANPETAYLISQVQWDARRWVPPFEFYPAGTGLYPHSDECVLSADENRRLQLIGNYVSTGELMAALWYLQFLHGNQDQWPAGMPRAVSDFQQYLNHPRTGRLRPDEILRAIRMAAVNGHAGSQVRLGVLYAKGQAVRTDYERAANWFLAAARQRDAQAMYYLGEMIQKNYVVRESDASAAVALNFYLQSAMGGYGPTRQRFQQLLDAGPCQDCAQPPRSASGRPLMPPRPTQATPRPQEPRKVGPEARP